MSLRLKPPLEKSKPGAKAGQSYRKAVDRSTWFYLCQRHQSTYPHLRPYQFLKSYQSEIEYNDTNRRQFNKKLEDYNTGKLQADDSGSRLRPGKFDELEKTLVEWIILRRRLYQKHKIGVNWASIKIKLESWLENIRNGDNEELRDKYRGFNASDGWIKRCFDRAKLEGVQLHGEADDLPDEHVAQLMAGWCVMLRNKIEEYNVPLGRIYNADQTALFYRQLPSRIYVKRGAKRDIRGNKTHKDKERLTLMVSCAADGTKVPLCVVGKPKNPTCFQLCPGRKPPIQYFDQKSAWFDREITLKWIHFVFIPHHKKVYGELPCILLLDNFTGQKGFSKVDTDNLPNWLHLVYFPANVTNRHQPCDMGIISSLKTGYKTHLLQKYLNIFDTDGGYDEAAQLRKTKKRGLRGVEYGGKAHILDAMNILHSIWSVDGKYAFEDGIQRCWRKANILPIGLQTDINADLGSNSMSESNKSLSEDESHTLCEIMNAMYIAQESVQVNTDVNAFGLQGSFISEARMEQDEISEALENWISEEDNQDIIDEIIEEEAVNLEAGSEQDDQTEEEDDDPVGKRLVDQYNNKDNINTGDTIVKKQSQIEIYEHLQICHEFARREGMEEDDILLLTRFESALRKVQLKKTRHQPSITSFFSSKQK